MKKGKQHKRIETPAEEQGGNIGEFSVAQESVSINQEHNSEKEMNVRKKHKKASQKLDESSASSSEVRKRRKRKRKKETQKEKQSRYERQLTSNHLDGNFDEERTNQKLKQPAPKHTKTESGSEGEMIPSYSSEVRVKKGKNQSSAPHAEDKHPPGRSKGKAPAKKKQLNKR